MPVSDEELADLWESGAPFDGGISHLEHLRVAWVLHRRHGREEALARLLDGTRRACEVHGCPEKFDAALTARWARAIADAMELDAEGSSATEFIATHPELRQGNRFKVEPRSG